jgi:hypothetical protein
MEFPQLIPASRLYGSSVFLSASVPTPERRDEYERISEAPLRIEEAVVCVARAVFIEGGTLVFGAHPSISPLVARVTDHYHLPAPAEKTHQKREPDDPGTEWRNPSLVMYQSRVWSEWWAEDSQHLTQHPLTSLRWVDAADGESIDPKIKDRPQAPKSMEKMRIAMIKDTAPLAMIAIGGMKGVLNEAELFREIWPERPIFALATTGGAAAMLAQRSGLKDSVRVIDHDAQNLVRKFWASQGESKKQDRFGVGEEREFYVPYAFVAQQIVAQIVEEWEKI